MADDRSFLEKVIANSTLQTVNEAQVATKIVFRILRDLLPREQVDEVATELETEAPKADMEIKDLWKDTNAMVSFFSNLSPVQQLNISKDTFMLRLKQEGQLPENADAENVAKAVFKATKEELSSEQIDNVSNCLKNDDILLLWQQA